MILLLTGEDTACSKQRLIIGTGDHHITRTQTEAIQTTGTMAAGVQTIGIAEVQIGTAIGDKDILLDINKIKEE